MVVFGLRRLKSKQEIGETIMTNLHLEGFRAALQAKKDEVTREINSRRDALVAQFTGDEMDKVRTMTGRASAAEALARISSLLALIEDARRRLDGGDFGKCQACGADLSRKRLESVPWAPYCIACQQLSERARCDVPNLQQPLAS
jgi:DnaK suppressor protein